VLYADRKKCQFLRLRIFINFFLGKNKAKPQNSLYDCQSAYGRRNKEKKRASLTELEAAERKSL
jgi:hypothetical protein